MPCSHNIARTFFKKNIKIHSSTIRAITLM
ncbi:hypothetical protein E2320_015646, partial [Naja naja]